MRTSWSPLLLEAISERNVHANRLPKANLLVMVGVCKLQVLLTSTRLASLRAELLVMVGVCKLQVLLTSIRYVYMSLASLRAE